MSELLKDPKHWRDRTEETRAAAERFSRSKAQKQKLLRVAQEYDRIADRPEQWRTVFDAEQQ